MKAFTPQELLTLSNVLVSQAYALVDQHPGDELFQQRAQHLICLANKVQEQWHERDGE